MVETRLQERSLTEQVDEIRSLHDLLATELKSRADSLDLRFDRLEALMFHNSTQLQATGKAPMDPGPSHPPTPISNNPHHTPNQPPDPPDMTGYFDRRDGRTPPPPTGLASRLSKIKFPSFDGTHLRDWISNCEQFFNIDGTPLEIKVCLTLMHLTGKATQWHHNYMSTRFGIFLSWTEYIVAISSRFSELYDDPLAELVDLKQGSDSVVDFLDKFETARMRLVLPEAHALSIFLANLNRHLSLHTRQFEVTTVAGAAKISMLQESSLLHTPKPSKPPFNPNWKQNQNTYPKPSATTPLLPTPLTPNKPQKANTFPNVTDK